MIYIHIYRLIIINYIFTFYPCYRAWLPASTFWYNYTGLKEREVEKYALRYAARTFASLVAEFCRLRTSRQRVCPLPLKVYTACLASSRRANSRNGRNSRNKIRFRSGARSVPSVPRSFRVSSLFLLSRESCSFNARKSNISPQSKADRGYILTANENFGLHVRAKTFVCFSENLARRHFFDATRNRVKIHVTFLKRLHGNTVIRIQTAPALFLRGRHTTRTSTGSEVPKSAVNRIPRRCSLFDKREIPRRLAKLGERRGVARSLAQLCGRSPVRMGGPSGFWLSGAKIVLDSR